MTMRMILRWGILTALLFLVSCQNPEGPSDNLAPTTPTQVKGSVLRNDNLAPVANAIVYDLGGLAKDTSKTDGSFLLKYQITSRYIGKVVASRVGFGNDTVNVILNPGIDTTITLRVKADSSSPIGGISSGKAANIVLVGSSGDNIAIRGTGANETAILTFEVRDSLGVTVGGTNKVRVNFSILGGPGGGEYIFPPSADTDPLTGRVTTRISSGTKAGVLQVYASATPVTGVTIKSSPVRLTISGGLPIAERFSISREKANIAGGVFDGLRSKISVIVGDKEGNPVQTGTAVSFTTTGGIIQPSATTDKDGLASVELISANPRPANGIAIVTAKTIGDSGVTISRNIPVLFSGATRIIAPSTTFEIPDSGEFNFAYKVQDANGNPLAGGSTITVTTSGPGATNLVVEGDGSVTLPDTDDPSYTNFSVKIRDTKSAGAYGPITVKIAVKSQNGDATYNFNGTVKPGEQVATIPPSARQPSQIAFISNTATDIFVSGVGGTENAVLTYEVRDSLGLPIDKLRRVYAKFDLQFFANTNTGGGSIPVAIPRADSSDDNGRLRASIVSGTQAGVVQLVVYFTLPSGKTVISQPVKISVHAGFPDQAHFTLLPSHYVFPGLGVFNKIGFTTVVGDTFSNPVQQKTPVYYQSWAGVMQTGTNDPFSNYTKEDGSSSAFLYTVNPLPIPPVLPGYRPPYYLPTTGMLYFAEIGGRYGYSWVIAQTQGSYGQKVSDSVLVVWAGAPIVITGVPATTVTVPINGAPSATINFTVKDVNGNPLPDGTSITATVVPPQNPPTGWSIVTSLSTGLPNAGYARFPGPNITDFSFNITNSSSAGVIPAGSVYQVQVIVNSPGLEIALRYFNIIMQ